MNDDDEEDFLDHYDDDPFHDIPPLGATDEEMLAMQDDEDFLARLRKGRGNSDTDEEFAALIQRFKDRLSETIAANREEYENG